MPKEIKTGEDLLKQSFLDIKDISRLLGIDYRKARTVYKLADQNDQRMQYRIEPRKVRITTVCEVAGTTIETLREQFTREERTK